MSFLKNCDQCKFYQRGYCTYFSRDVLTIGEAKLCPYYSVIGIVTIADLENIAGTLVSSQIPSKIISTAKLVDLSITSAKLATNSVIASKILDAVITDAKIAAAAAILESKLDLDYSTSSLDTDIQTRQPSSEKDQASGYLGLDGSAKVPLSKLNPLLDAQIDAAAAILESKLDLDYSTSSLDTDIQTRQPSSEKDQASGYLGLDGSAKVPLSKLNPLLDAQIDAAAAILESKLNLDYSTSSLNTAIGTKLDTSAHTKAAHDSLALSHDSLSDVSTSDHHAKYLDSEAVSAMGTKGDSNPLHHDKYTDGEVESVITAELVTGQSIDNAIDSLISTHASDDDAHHAVLEPVGSPSAGDIGRWSSGSQIGPCSSLTEVVLHSLLMFGAIYNAYVSCTIGLHVNGYRGLVGISNAGTDDLIVQYVLGLPMVKGSLKLYMDAVRVSVRDADADDYVKRVRVAYASDTDVTVVLDDDTHQTAPGAYVYTFSAVDLSEQHTACAYVEGFNTDPYDLDIMDVSLRVWYG